MSRTRIDETVFELPIRTEGKLRDFVEQVFEIRIPDKQICDEHVAPWTAFCHAYFGRSSIMVWEGSRGMAGKSHLLAVLGLTMALTLKCDVNILGGSGEQSRNVQKYISGFLRKPTIPVYDSGTPV